MNVLKNIGIVLITIIAIAMLAVCIFPFLKVVDVFLGLEPVIICAALLILGFVFSFIIKNPHLEKLFGILIGVTILAVILYYVLINVFGASVPIWIVLLIVFAVAVATFLTTIINKIPFISKNVIGLIWFITIMAVFMIIVFNTVPVE